MVGFMVWQPQDYLRLLEIVFIPIVILIVIFYFRNSIKSFLEKLAPRISKVQAFGVTIELSKSKELKPSWISDTNDDFRGLTPSYAFDSGASNLIQIITSNPDTNYAIIDLEYGSIWLTSRLYIFSVLFDLYTNIEYLVFVDSDGSKTYQFIGYANLKDIRWALAKTYPWLEKAFAEAYNNYYLNEEVSLPENPDSAASVVQTFLASIQLPNAPQPPEDAKKWVEPKPGMNTWEKSRWIDRYTLFTNLGHVIRKEYVIDSMNQTKEERIRAILRQNGPLVAILDQDNSFQTLIDREALLETVTQGSI